MNKRFYIAIIFLLGWASSYAQEEWEESTGEIEDVEVEIIKDREITLLRASRNFEKITPTFTPSEPVKFDYQFQQFDFDIPDLTFRLRPLRIKSEPLNKLYGGYLKAGFGNFNTPYLEGYVNNKRDQQFAYGAHVKHLSSKNGAVDDENSGVSDTEVDVFGKVFTKKAVLGGSLGYEMNKVHFYGYPDGTDTTASDIEQKFNWIMVNGFVKSNNKADDPGYKLALGYTNVSDDFEASEGILDTNFQLTYPMDDNKVAVDANMKVISRKDANVSDSRFVTNITPSYSFEYNYFKIKAGLNIAYENDTLENLNKLHLYPVIQASYDVSSNLNIYAGIDGGIQANTLQSVIRQNPFIAADVPIYHTNQLFNFTGGVRGKVGQSSYVHAGFSMSGYEYFQYMINSALPEDDQSKFAMLYDSETTTVSNIFGEWGLAKNQEFHLSLRGDYYAYNTGSTDEAWHRPQYKVSALAKYNLFDKLIFEGKLAAQGGIKAYDNTTDQVIDLDPAVDLGLQGTYLFSEQFSVFLKFNNILSQEYELLYRYPVRGFQVMGGLSYTF